MGDDFCLMGRTIVITGATRGIGRAIALKLAAQGDRLVLNYSTNEESAQETFKRCLEFHSEILLIKADVANRREVEMLFEQSYQRFRTLDILLNNASVNIDRPFLEMSEAEWDQVVDINMKGVFLCSQIAGSYLIQQEHGGIILNVGASTGIRGRKNGINYCAAKAGVLVMTKCLAMELAPKVRVNCVIPGFTWTEETAQRYHLDKQEHVAAKEATIPLQRIGTPEEIADVVSFLLSHDARYINGQKVLVDGGQFMY